MRRKILFIVLTIVLAAGLIGGGTMAWFTAKAQVDNTFTAGTVMIEAGEEVVYGYSSMENVNPGDAFKKCIPIFNTGSKNIRLRMSNEFELDIDWVSIEENWKEFCFTEEYGEDGFYDFKAAVLAALSSGEVTNPADAAGDPNGVFDENGKLVIPIMVAPTAVGDWFMKDVGGKNVFFYDGILEPNDDTTLCVVVVFDGPWMGNLWQGAKFTMGGTFEAVQASNDAPQAVWGEATWANYENVSGLAPRDQLLVDFSEEYTNYFYDVEGNFYYWYLCILNGNGNGGWFDETAWGGDSEGDGAAWWFYFDMTAALEEGSDTQTIWAGQDLNAGSVTIELNSMVKITMSLSEDWRLQQDDNGDVISEAVKIKGYNYDELPATRPASGQLDDYKGTALYVELDHNPPYDVYLIHMDVEEYRLLP